MLTKAQGFALFDLSHVKQGASRELGIHLNTLSALHRNRFIEQLGPDVWRITEAGREMLRIDGKPRRKIRGSSHRGAE